MSFSLGNALKMHVFGESHGKCIGVVVEGMPAGLSLGIKDIQKELDKRKPGASEISSSRKEEDKAELLSGVFNGKTTGAPIAIIIRNQDAESSIYDESKDLLRPGHADFTAAAKFKHFNDFRGGGIFSGRMTAAMVAAGAIAKKILETEKTEIQARAIQIGKAKGNSFNKKMRAEILKAKKEGDSIGGLIECTILGLPPGIGEPMFDSIESVLSHAMFSIPGIKGVEFGSGFKAAEMSGSEHNDEFVFRNGRIETFTNNAGGILGGISNGMPVIFRIAVKPTPSISRPQKTVNLKTLKEQEIKIKGRHDPCIVPRAIPVVENLTAFCIADLVLRGGIFHG